MPKSPAKPKPNNPRRITEKRLKELREKLRAYGDLSGVIHNTRTGNLVGGNQRSRVFNLESCEIEIIHEHEIDEQGTTALGFILWEGKRYSYRRVDWPEDVEDAACIIANVSAGAWDTDALAGWGDKVAGWAGVDKEFVASEFSAAAMWDAMLKAGEAEDAPDFKEYGEDIADGVSVCECPTCGHKHAKKN